jgi:hypothetical protein
MGGKSIAKGSNFFKGSNAPKFSGADKLQHTHFGQFSTLLIKEQTRIILHPPNLCVHKTISTVRSFSHRRYNRTDFWLRFRSNCSAGQTTN